MRKQTKKDLCYLALFIVKGVVITLIFTAAMVAISIIVELLAEPFNVALWGAYDFIMGLL